MALLTRLHCWCLSSPGTIVINRCSFFSHTVIVGDIVNYQTTHSRFGLVWSIDWRCLYMSLDGCKRFEPQARCAGGFMGPITNMVFVTVLQLSVHKLRVDGDIRSRTQPQLVNRSQKSTLQGRERRERSTFCITDDQLWLTGKDSYARHFPVTDPCFTLRRYCKTRIGHRKMPRDDVTTSTKSIEPVRWGRISWPSLAGSEDRLSLD